MTLIRLSLLALLLASQFFSFSQSYNSGIVKYKVKNTKNRLTDNELRQNPRLPMILEQLTFSLNFIDSNATFNLDESRTIPPEDVKSAEIFFIGVSTNRHFWQNPDAAYRVMPALPPFHKDYLLVDSFKSGRHTGWKITNESKEIAGYKCFKATRDNLSQNGSGGLRRIPVIAWFCPELPFPFGPLKYGGLPGLILELQTNTTIFGAKSISLGENIAILPMPEFELISEEQFYRDIHKKIMERRGKIMPPF
ncbi:GLPGLI family protein [Parapedobacter luteus]|uniref:GLPGLI family protein n=1 Tax=Parapedobacter luteus TaxID=623280 RepID=A0A1T5CEV4_9SPHI|nr:GLPGLI family protein [Parapedobacter luteus]